MKELSYWRIELICILSTILVQHMVQIKVPYDGVKALNYSKMCYVSNCTLSLTLWLPTTRSKSYASPILFVYMSHWVYLEMIHYFFCINNIIYTEKPSFHTLYQVLITSSTYCFVLFAIEMWKKWNIQQHGRAHIVYRFQE